MLNILVDDVTVVIGRVLFSLDVIIIMIISNWVIIGVSAFGLIARKVYYANLLFTHLYC
jgi:hypothetical protein